MYLLGAAAIIFRLARKDGLEAIKSLQIGNEQAQWNAGLVKAFNSTSETDLYNFLFPSTFNPLVRPSSRVDVRVGFHLLTINELSTKSQTLSVSGFFSLVWNDPRLTWNASSYSGITKTYQTESKIWRPEVIIDNSVTDLEPLHSPDDQMKLRLLDSGEVKWETAGIYVVHCDIDITYYPFDSQKCYLELTSWAYTITEVFLNHTSTDINLEDLKENGEWTVQGTSTSYSVLHDDGEIRPQLEFIMHLRRRPAFYVLNIIFPVIITSALTPVVFLLPSQSGEKVSYTLTLLLAIAVVLSIISEQMPTTSIHTSVFAIYLALNLGLAAVSILVSVAVLYAHHQNESRTLPNSLKKVTKHIFMKFPRHKKLGSFHAGQKPEVTPKPPNGDMKMERMNGQKKTSPVDDGITWMDFSESLDAFSFRVFLMAFVVFFVVFMIALGIGAAIPIVRAKQKNRLYCVMYLIIFFQGVAYGPSLERAQRFGSKRYRLLKKRTANLSERISEHVKK